MDESTYSRYSGAQQFDSIIVPNDNQHSVTNKEGFEDLQEENEITIEQPIICLKNNPNPFPLFRKSIFCSHTVFSNCKNKQYPSGLDELPQSMFCETIGQELSCIEPQKKISLGQKKPQNVIFRDYFPYKLQCAYSKFGENMMKKYDFTSIIVNVCENAQKTIENGHGHFQSRKKQIEGNDVKAQFGSEFQGGNLYCVFKDNKHREIYYLFLQNDVNTHGFNQWFFFWVRMAKQKCRFLIMNISKDFKYRPEMRLLTYSTTKGKWQRITPFLYYKNVYSKYNGGKQSTVDFCYNFEANQQVYFCLSYPYSYCRLGRTLETLQSHSGNAERYSIQVRYIGKSEGNNMIPLVIFRANQIGYQCKKNVIFIARQHPSETAGSLVCEFLMAALKDSNNMTLLKKFNFYFLPMANPDGVIHGNSRTNLKGYDINRCWDRLSLSKSVESSAINAFLQKFMETSSLDYVIDLHSHSRDYGAFAYFNKACGMTKCTGYTLQKYCPFFQYAKCRYGIPFKRRPTLRAQLLYRLAVEYAMTIEISFYGYQIKGSLIPFHKGHYKQLAIGILNALIDTEDYRTNSKARQLLDSKIGLMEKKRTMEQAKEQSIQELDSDSDPQEDYLLPTERIGSLNFSDFSKNKTLINSFAKNGRMNPQLNLSLNAQKSPFLCNPYQAQISQSCKKRKSYMKNRSLIYLQQLQNSEKLVCTRHLKGSDGENSYQRKKAIRENKTCYDWSKQTNGFKYSRVQKQTRAFISLRKEQKKVQMMQKKLTLYPTSNIIRLDVRMLRQQATGQNSLDQTLISLNYKTIN